MHKTIFMKERRNAFWVEFLEKGIDLNFKTFVAILLTLFEINNLEIFFILYIVVKRKTFLEWSH